MKKNNDYKDKTSSSTFAFFSSIVDMVSRYMSKVNNDMPTLAKNDVADGVFHIDSDVLFKRLVMSPREEESVKNALRHLEGLRHAT